MSFVRMTQVSLRSALPSLRPGGRSPLDTPRGLFSKSVAAANPRFSSDFELTRNLFKPAKKPNQCVHPIAESDEVPTPSRDMRLKDVDALIIRIPSATEPVSAEDAACLSPVLDRVLATVTSWDPAFIAVASDDSSVVDLLNRLFALIDVNDFLTRTIVCRILLSFATSPDSPLLVPVARIFYKLSCDQSNDEFFRDEQLDGVLIQLVRVGEREARVFAACAIKNIAACEELRDMLVSGGFVSLVKEVLSGDNFDGPVRLQIMGALKTMCRSNACRMETAQSDVVMLALADPSLFSETSRILAMLEDIPVRVKGEIVAVLAKKDIGDSKTRRGCIRAALAVDDGTSAFGFYVAGLVKASKKPDELQPVLSIAERVVDVEVVRKRFESDGVICSIVKSQSYETCIRLGAYLVLKKFVGDEFATVAREYDMLGQIQNK